MMKAGVCKTDDWDLTGIRKAKTVCVHTDIVVVIGSGKMPENVLKSRSISNICPRWK